MFTTVQLYQVAAIEEIFLNYFSLSSTTSKDDFSIWQFHILYCNRRLLWYTKPYLFERNAFIHRRTGKYDALHVEGLAPGKISRKIGRTSQVIKKYLENQEGRGRSLYTRQNAKLTSRDGQTIVREASKSGLSASQLPIVLHHPLSKRRVQQTLQDPNILSFWNLEKQPTLTENHKKQRLKWTRQ